jgi:ribonuclease D
VPESAPESTATPLTEPREGLPPVTADDAGLARVAAAIAAGTGPIAVDTERASGYRYGQSAYLVQLRRDGSGSHLVDPIGIDDWTPLIEALDGPEWVLHSASQDIPALRELGLRIRSLFDTELAARLLGLPRVGLAALLEQELGFLLAKEHSAVDWSTRPLPEPWLRYAALDVELLLDLRDILAERLVAAGKYAWAQEEFATIIDAPPAAPRTDPWRRTSGIHKVRGARRLAVVRELWEARDEVAQARDVAPGRLVPDSAIVAAAQALPTSDEALLSTQGFIGRAARTSLPTWWAAVATALALPDDQCPAPPKGDGPPPPRAWADRYPEAAVRWEHVRPAMLDLAATVEMPVENLLTPDLVRRLTFDPPAPLTDAAIRDYLRAGGAREWQVTQSTPTLLTALEAAKDAPPVPSEPVAAAAEAPAE